MKTNTTIVLFAGFLTFSSIAENTKADIIISNILLSSTSLQFDISGTFPNNLPPPCTFGDIVFPDCYYDDDALYFVNPDVTADPGFALGYFIEADTSSFTGSQVLREQPIATGLGNHGIDYFYVVFDQSIMTGEAMHGTITAKWTIPAFDPTEILTLDVYWGANYSLPTIADTLLGGIYLTSATVVPTVPEPSSLLLMGSGLIALTLRRRRQR